MVVGCPDRPLEPSTDTLARGTRFAVKVRTGPAGRGRFTIRPPDPKWGMVNRDPVASHYRGKQGTPREAWLGRLNNKRLCQPGTIQRSWAYQKRHPPRVRARGCRSTARSTAAHSLAGPPPRCLPSGECFGSHAPARCSPTGVDIADVVVKPVKLSGAGGGRRSR